MGAKQGSAKLAADERLPELDPKFEWIENAADFVLRLNLLGFSKDHFAVQVDGAGRLTVRGQRPADGKRGARRFHRVFQLPSACSLDDITGRFDHAGVLALTVPKRQPAAAPTTVEEIKKPNAMRKPTPEEETAKEGGVKRKVRREEEEDAKERKQERPQMPTPVPAVAETASAPAEKPQRRGEEENPAAAAAPAEQAEREKTAARGGSWRERMAGELEDLADMSWVEGIVETVRNNKEVVAAAVAAFSLGVLVSHKFLRRN